LKKLENSKTTGFAPNITPAKLRELYYQMLRIRRFEERIAEVYAEQEMRCPTHFSIGEEAAAVGVCAALKLDDVIFSNHRCHAHYLAKGGDARRMIAELYGRATGCTGGKGGSMHLSDESAGMMGASAIVGASIPLAMGAALAFSMQGKRQVAVSFFGDAGPEQGIFHESLNFAALKRLPVIFVCENNLYATQTPLSRRQARNNIYQRGRIYGIPGKRIDGNDVLKVYLAAKEAASNCRNGKGPVLLELMTYRYREHVGPNYDWDLGYRTQDEVESWMKKADPLARWQKRLLRAGLISRAELDAMLDKINSEVEAALARAKADPMPADSELLTNVY
jgi:pyruvate dehydrogenase E1 component alpha subunit